MLKINAKKQSGLIQIFRKELFKLNLPYETGDVDMDESGHQVLTVKAIHDSTMARNSVRKILYGDKKGQSRGHWWGGEGR